MIGLFLGNNRYDCGLFFPEDFWQVDDRALICCEVEDCAVFYCGEKTFVVGDADGL